MSFLNEIIPESGIVKMIEDIQYTMEKKDLYNKKVDGISMKDIYENKIKNYKAINPKYLKNNRFLFFLYLNYFLDNFKTSKSDANYFNFIDFKRVFL